MTDISSNSSHILFKCEICLQEFGEEAELDHHKIIEHMK
jgi:hypothetical protein